MRIDQSKIPNMKPLYWKCMWSTIRNPGWRNNEAEIIRCVDGSAAPRMNLWIGLKLKTRGKKKNLLDKDSPKDEFGQDD